MPHLTHASRELFRRPPDERFASLSELFGHCQAQKERSYGVREPSTLFRPVVEHGRLALQVNGHAPYRLNDWSFAQLCSWAGAAKDTVNRLRPETAVRVLSETLEDRVHPQRHWQGLVFDHDVVRAITGEKYRRLWNADLVAMLLEFAPDFTPPQPGLNGATGLYAGEQDLFCFLIDPTGWIEIEGEAFAPGFFVWNSEVGRRTLGISTFWFQAVCQNHIVWDSSDVRTYARRHVGDVRGSLQHVRAMIETLVEKRDEHKDAFAALIARAMTTTYGQDVEEVQNLLVKAGFTKELGRQAALLARERGRFTIWAVVDALTRLAREHQFAGARTIADEQASFLLALAQ